MNRKNFLLQVLKLSVASGFSGTLNLVSSGRINRICNYLNDKVKKDAFFVIDTSHESPEGGELKCYYDGQFLRKIVSSQFWESGKLELNLFLRYGQLLKAEERHYHYNVPVYIDNTGAKEMGIESFDINKAKVQVYDVLFAGNKLPNVVQNDQKFELDLKQHEYADIINQCQLVISNGSLL